MTTEIRQ